MAIMLYRAGSDHVVQGVECEVMTCEIPEMDHYLSEGWVKSPAEIDGPSDAPQEEPEDDPEIEADDPKEE